MVLDTTVDEVFAYSGHDGSAIVFPDLNEPHCRRGHSLYEMAQLCLYKGYGLTPMSPRYSLESMVSGEKIEVSLDPVIVDELYGQENMVLVGTLPTGSGHAMAWTVDDKIVYCPSGNVYSRVSNPMSVEIMLLCSPLKWPPLLSSKPVSG
jgi:hypothetical protein